MNELQEKEERSERSLGSKLAVEAPSKPPHTILEHMPNVYRPNLSQNGYVYMLHWLRLSVEKPPHCRECPG